ncbi:hypothetical protein [Methylomonas sp. HYX-M1]|uniref:hypothetical protein n=1 Tax=Methylomonas sp. HYX-M1 TaxID=3139307 RepID=UPI00345BED92
MEQVYFIRRMTQAYPPYGPAVAGLFVDQAAGGVVNVAGLPGPVGFQHPPPAAVVAVLLGVSDLGEFSQGTVGAVAVDKTAVAGNEAGLIVLVSSGITLTAVSRRGWGDVFPGQTVVVVAIGGLRRESPTTYGPA